MTRLKTLGCFLTIAILMLTWGAMSQSPTNSQKCQIDVAAPIPGTSVDTEVMVEGTAKLPPSSFLWIFVGLRGQIGYWPQGGSAARLGNDGKWEVLARLGNSNDKGRSFVIIPTIVNPTTHEMLRRYVEDSSKSGDWPPFPKLPGVVQGCPIVPVNVTRNRT